MLRPAVIFNSPERGHAFTAEVMHAGELRFRLAPPWRVCVAEPGLPAIWNYPMEVALEKGRAETTYSGLRDARLRSPAQGATKRWSSRRPGANLSFPMALHAGTDTRPTDR
jgi:hypothetical protein